MNIDRELFEEVRTTTGLTHERLFCVAGTVYATIFIGKIPNREELSAYLGCSKKIIGRALREVAASVVKVRGETTPLSDWLCPYLMSLDRPDIAQVIYPLAANFVSTGTYIGKDEEPFERAIARYYLQILFFPQMVQDYETFAGYNILLGYLWEVAYGSDETAIHFCQSHFETSFGASSKVKAFLELVYQKNPHLYRIVEEDAFTSITNYMAGELKKVRGSFKDRGSAKIAKERLKAMKNITK
ncbi:hypothetical protein IJG93_01555 [Candidatus Saccharibacteria bacterium]|nr:hypothetical protein [Candidatus Saccharibacteria bacterium]